MKIANYRWLAAVIAAHPNRELLGRTRLQKTIKLLQRLGFPTDYDYTNFFYGPYSESVQADVGLLCHLGLIEEKEFSRGDGNPYYKFTATAGADLEEINPYRSSIQTLSQTETIVLELAATYDSYLEMGFSTKEALHLLHKKKRDKCTRERVHQAMELLQSMGLINSIEHTPQIQND